MVLRCSVHAVMMWELVYRLWEGNDKEEWRYMMLNTDLWGGGMCEPGKVQEMSERMVLGSSFSSPFSLPPSSPSSLLLLFLLLLRMRNVYLSYIYTIGLYGYSVQLEIDQLSI